MCLYQCVFTIKLLPNGYLDRYEACLVVKGFSQTYGIEYFQTFSSGKIKLYPCFFFLGTELLFADYDLAEEVYMNQLPGFIVQEE